MRGSQATTMILPISFFLQSFNLWIVCSRVNKIVLIKMTESHSDRYSKVGNYEPVAQRQEMLIGTLALLLCKQGSGPRDGQTGVQIPPVFYRTLSPPVPTRAAALLTYVLPLGDTKAGQGYR